jgi:carboxyl-terminal processing protease
MKRNSGIGRYRYRARRNFNSFCWITASLIMASLSCSSSGKAPVTEEQPLLNLAQRQSNIESFEQMWNTVNITFWDEDFGGVDWLAIHREYLPLVTAATTMKEARQAMIGALDELGQSHFYIIPAELYDDMSGGPRGSGDTGLRARAVDGRAIVIKVIPGSAADKAGIVPGWEILIAGEKELPPFLAELKGEYEGSPTMVSKLSLSIRGRLRGEIGDEFPLHLVDGEGQEHQMTLILGEPAGQKAIFGNLPPAWVHFESRRLDGDVGYIAFNMFMAPSYVMVEFQSAVADFRDCNGMVIDLRGNLGGIAGMGMGLAGWFITEKGLRLGEMTTRTSNINMLVNPRQRGYGGPLAILVDGLSASTAEFMASGLQDLGRARVFGSHTAGAALVANMDRLPNGDGFEYAIANYTSAGGTRIEGNGVNLDVESPYSREALLDGRDLALDAALDWIGSENSSNQKTGDNHEDNH